MTEVHPQFKVFFGKGKRPEDTAAISIHRRGALHLNRAAYQALGEPAAVEFSFDERLKIVGLRGVSADLAHAYGVKEGHHTSYVVTATAFCNACKIDRSQARRYKATKYGEHIGIDLTAPIAVTSRSNKPEEATRTAARRGNSMAVTKRPGKTAVSYRVTVEYPADPLTGKRRRSTETFRTKKEADAREREWLTAIERGTAVDGTKMTVAQLFVLWLEVLKGTNPKERTVIEYERTIRTHIVPVLGATRVQRVTTATIDAFNTTLREKGCSDAMVHRCHKRLRQAFDYALKRRIIAMNPMLAIDPPTVRSRPAVVLTGQQINRFLTRATNNPYSPLWLLVVQTGMRRGEVLALRWQDVDLARRQVRVRQCIEEINGKVHLTTPKTAAALRTITLFPESVAALCLHHDRQAFRRQAMGDTWRDMGLVFASDTGGPITPSNVLRNLYAIITEANKEAQSEDERLPRFHIHDLRHTHATHLLMERWDVARVARRLGHANPSITLRLYAHAITDVQGEDIVTPAAFAFAGTA